nr:PREDICTED: CAAX prenyl protease 2 [Lepisosteus oculatus]
MGVRPSPPLLALMGIRLEGLIPAATLPLLLTMVLFLGPLIQMAMDCPWDFIDGLKVGIVPRLPAHFHHVIELLRFRQGTVLGIFLSAVFQFSYTAVFGAYTAFIFIRTGECLTLPCMCVCVCVCVCVWPCCPSLSAPGLYVSLFLSQPLCWVVLCCCAGLSLSPCVGSSWVRGLPLNSAALVVGSGRTPALMGVD